MVAATMPIAVCVRRILARLIASKGKDSGALVPTQVSQGSR
jgi:hypothetical protein